MWINTPSVIVPSGNSFLSLSRLSPRSFPQASDVVVSLSALLSRSRKDLVDSESRFIQRVCFMQIVKIGENVTTKFTQFAVCCGNCKSNYQSMPLTGECWVTLLWANVSFREWVVSQTVSAQTSGVDWQISYSYFANLIYYVYSLLCSRLKW